MANLRPNVELRQGAAVAFAQRLRPIFDCMAARQFSQREMVTELDEVGSPAPKRGAWRLSQVQRVLTRIVE
jgi:hypothetical protein